MLVRRRRAGRGDQRLAVPGAAVRQQLLDAADRIAVAVQELVDAVRERHIGGAIITAVAGALERTQLREARLPIAQYMLRKAEIACQLADRSEGVVALAGGVRHGLSRR